MATKTTTPALPPHLQGELDRCNGDGFLLWVRVQRALGEMTFYRGMLRHRTQAEGSEGWSHEDWRLVSIALLRATADAVEAGGMEPAINTEVRSLLEEVALLQRKAQRLETEHQGAAARTAYGVGGQ